MSTLRFSDGMNIDTSGPYRVTRKSDGLYVVGNGFMCAVDSHEEGNKLVAELKGEVGNAKKCQE